MPRLFPFLALPFALGLANLAQAADSVTLKIAHFLPALSNAQKHVIEPWCARLEKDSEGRLKCQIYPSLQLGGTAAKLVDQVRNGVADIVWTAPGYSPGRFPKTEAVELPGVIPLGGVAGGQAVWSFFQQHLEQDEYKDFKVLAMHGDGGMNLHTSDRQIDSLDDLQGLKIRAPNRVISNTLEALGAAPVAMPPAQVPEAISKGVVDGASAVWEVVLPAKLNEVTRYHLDTPADRPALGNTVLAMLMNKRTYKRLPADLRAIVDRHSGAALVQRFGEAWDRQIESTKAQVLADGHSITVLSDDAYDEALKRLEPLKAEWVRQAKGFDGAALLEAAQTLYPQS